MSPEIVSSRVLPYPVERVYAAFSDPSALAQWWGPEGFANRFDVFELRAGGAWNFVMYAPDGTSYSMAKRFTEVVPLERIVLEHLEPPQHRFRMTIEFLDLAAETGMTWRMVFEVPGEADRVREVILDANEQNFDRLERHLSHLPA